ncbi:hypothetical protein N0V93_010311 [Gnomoniopsis smithogilvyi]|uniref:Uncharacterized protein n=1 Tax=Gnomoniopsis smithogilvyi TaxID=1191159 RepID=A0A9W8YJ12_9PEZI|nr:hypothetical protein N0V93_010311 [Gnomoniopsis smithogilvyi]
MFVPTKALNVPEKPHNVSDGGTDDKRLSEEQVAKEAEEAAAELVDENLRNKYNMSKDGKAGAYSTVGPPKEAANDKPDFAALLYHSNRKPPSYYLDRMQKFDEKKARRTRLGPRTEKAMDGVLWEWRAYVFVSISIRLPRKKNRPMTLNQLKLQIETTLSTTEKDFKLGELRVLCVLFLESVSVLEDCGLLVAVVINRTPRLMAPAGSRTAVILKQELVLPLQPELASEDLFRRVERSVFGYRFSSKRATYHMMHKSLQRISKIYGWEGNATSYSLRYMADNNVNESADVGNALQNLVIDHAPNSAVL